MLCSLLTLISSVGLSVQFLAGEISAWILHFVHLIRRERLKALRMIVDLVLGTLPATLLDHFVQSCFVSLPKTVVVLLVLFSISFVILEKSSSFIALMFVVAKKVDPLLHSL